LIYGIILSDIGELKKILDRLPLSESEREIYLALLSHGPLSGSEISDITGIERYTVYTMLSRLDDKGFVDVPPSRRASKYKAVPPKEAIDEFKSKLDKRHKEELEKLDENHKKELEKLDQIATLLSKLDVKEEKLLGTKPSDQVWLINSEARIKKGILRLLEKTQRSILACIPTIDTPTKRKTRQEFLERLEIIMKKKKAKIQLVLHWELEEGTADEKIANSIAKNKGIIYQWGIGELPFSALFIDGTEGLVILQSTINSPPQYGLALWIRHPIYVEPFENLIKRFGEFGIFRKWT